MVNDHGGSARVSRGLSHTQTTRLREAAAEEHHSGADPPGGGDDALVPRARELTGSSQEERSEDLLDHLADGPTPVELGEQLSTALLPDVTLVVTDITAGTPPS